VSAAEKHSDAMLRRYSPITLHPNLPREMDLSAKFMVRACSATRPLGLRRAKSRIAATFDLRNGLVDALGALAEHLG
jgi:hypothetical protein